MVLIFSHFSENLAMTRVGSRAACFQAKVIILYMRILRPREWSVPGSGSRQGTAGLGLENHSPDVWARLLSKVLMESLAFWVPPA